MKIITPIGIGQFRVSTLNIPDSEITLNFLPIIEKFKLSGKYYLLHWQARPKGHREFGIYNGLDDTYVSVEKLSRFGYGGIDLLQLDDSRLDNSLPSAVIYFTGSIPL